MIFTNYTIYDGKIYEVYFDKYNLKNRFFENGIEVSGDILLALNKKYNENTGYLKVSDKLLVGILSTTILLSSFGGMFFTDSNADQHTHNYLANRDIQSTEEVVDIDDFYNTLVKNSTKNSEYIKYMKEPINDNLSYLRYNELLRNISSLKIVEGGEGKFSGPDVMGKYEEWSNRITLRNDLNTFDKKDTLIHELFHYLSGPGITKFNNLKDGFIGDALNEGITQELVNEYFTESLTVYPIGVAYTKALTEIVGKDVMLSSYFQGDLDNLIAAMSSYTTVDNAYKLIKNIDQAEINYNYYLDSYSDVDLANLQANSEEAWNIISEMYEVAFGKDIKDDKLMYLYKSSTMLADVKSNVDVLHINVLKNYFNPDRLNTENYDVYYYTRYGDVLYDRFSEKDRFEKKAKKRN